MARSQARSGFGLQLWRGDGATPTEVFTKVPEVTDVQNVGVKVLETVESTHMESDNGYKEYIPTLKDEGEMTCDVNWLIGNAVQNSLATDFENRTLRNFRLILPGAGKRLEGAAFVTNISSAVPRDGKMTRTFTLKKSGLWNEVVDP